MSFFSSFKRAFGFGADDIAADEDLYADTADDNGTTGPADRADKDNVAIPQPIEPLKFDPAMQQMIFDRILAVFNEALPDFLARTGDHEARRKYLFDSLDEGVRSYLDSLNAKAEEYCEAQWKNRQAGMAAEMEALRIRSEEIERQSTDIKQKQLSADRQKRALTERVHDLESQLSRLESEREQYELENRSLVNRIKVANVQQADLEKAQADISALQAELVKMRANPDQAFAEREESLQKQISEMTDGIDSLKEQLRVANLMHDDMRHRLAESDKLAADREAKLEEAASLQATLAERDATIDRLNKTIQDTQDIISHVSDLEKALTQRDDNIATQKLAIAGLEDEIEALKATISENMRLQARREKELKDEIKALRPPTVVAEMTVDFNDTAEDTAPRISEDDLSVIEETFESGEWFTKTPPPETPSMRPAESEAEFGYRAPRRKTPANDHPGQLSLF